MSLAKEACLPLLKNNSCGLEESPGNWNFKDCEFIDIDEDISRDIFAAYMDGMWGVDLNVLEIEVTDDTLRN
tara:strand:+ start:195 stop:410 length:216 start_codon:yes stop_codon:yes gene_type:complete